MTAPSTHHEIIELKKDRLSAKYIGKGRSSFDIGSIRTNRPWRSTRHFHYFEAYIEQTAPRGQIYIGLSESNFLWNKNPGHYPNSYGFRSDDGKKVSAKGLAESYGPPFGQHTTIGCGLDTCSGAIFFTHNGNYLGKDAYCFLSPTHEDYLCFLL